MSGYKTTAIVFSLLIGIVNIHAQPAALSVIDTLDMKRNLSFIASEEMEGRSLGTEVDGLNKVADYLASNAQKLGLKPAAPGYFQKVGMIASRPGKNNFVQVINNRGKSLWRTRLLVEINSSENFREPKELPVVMAGFGENLSGIDFNGKAVVLSSGSKDIFERKIFRWNNRHEHAKIDSVTAKNPAAILIITHPEDKHEKVFKQISAWFSRERYNLKPKEEQKEAPILLLLPEVADELLGGRGKYRKYLEDIVKSGDDQPVLVGDKMLKLKIGKQNQPIDAKNVVAVLEGSDPKLKDECVVFMAHYDHLGVDENGEVYNGADDNGSGTVTIMEIAEAFSKLDKKPKRSIIFLWVTGEEIGLLGSNYYTEHPLFPLEKTAACFNLDMVGRVFEKRDTVWNRSPKRVKDFDGIFALSNDVWPGLAEINQKYCKQLGLDPDTTLPSVFLRSSDHYHFHKNGVPILNYATGYHADYHKVSDELEKINFSKMKRVAELCFLVGLEVANRENITRIETR